MGSQEGTREGKVIIILLLVLALGAGFFALKKDREARSSRELAETHKTAAKDARADGLKLGKQVQALELSRKKLKRIIKEFDAAPRLVEDSPEVSVTGIINPGEVFSGEKPMALVDPVRLAESAASLVSGGEQDGLLADCRTDRDEWKTKHGQEVLRAQKWKGRFPLGILAGAATVGVIWVANNPPWRKR